MNGLARFLRKLWNLAYQQRFHAELEEEMAFHRDQTEKELLAGGMDPEAVPYAARRRFGNSTRLTERSHEIATFQFEAIFQDFRYAVRGLKKSSGFTFTAILTLALGIGAATAVYSVAYGTLIDPFPYKDVGKLVTPKLCSPEFSHCYWDTYTPAQFLEIARNTTIFSGVTASAIHTVTLTGESEAQRLRGTYITPNAFDVLGVQPILGRESKEDDVLPGHEEVALLSYRYWQAHFGGNLSILGKVLDFDGHPRTIIGIMPPRFLWRGGDVYLPVGMTDSEQQQHSFTLIGRLKPGITEGQAASELQPIFDDFARSNPHRFPKDLRLGIMPFDQMFRSGLAGMLYLLLGSVFILLLIACVNVSSLLLARAANREHEIAVRAAIGATRGRLARYAFAESLLLALAALPVALAFAYAGLRAILRILPAETIPSEAVITMNLPVLFASIGIGLLTVILFGFAPAWHTARPFVSAALNSVHSSTSRGQRRLLSGLVVAEIALSLALLMLAGLMIRSLIAVERVPVPFSPDHTLLVRIPLDPARYPTAGSRFQFFRQFLERAAHLPGVKAVTPDSEFPFREGTGSFVQIHQEPIDLHTSYCITHFTDPQYLEISGQRMLEGHFIDQREIAEQAHEAVVTEGFVRHFFKDQNVLNHTIHLPEFTGDEHGSRNDGFTIVGVMSDLPTYPGYEERFPAVLLPFSVALPYSVAPLIDTVVISTTLPAKELINPVRQLVDSIDKDQPVSDAMTLREILDMYGYAGPRFALALFGSFAAAALLLALIGVYGVLSFVTSRRTQEIGIRMALGGNRAHVLWMVLRQACLLALLGVGVGIPLALAGGYFAKSFLIHTSQHDPIALLAAVCILPLLAVAGTLLPAYRAAAIDPVKALRAE